MGGFLNQRQQQLLALVKERKAVKLADISTLFPDVSSRSLQRDFALLESEGLIERIGKGKLTAYSVV